MLIHTASPEPAAPAAHTCRTRQVGHHKICFPLRSWLGWERGDVWTDGLSSEMCSFGGVRVCVCPLAAALPMHVRVRKLAEKKRKVQGESKRGGQDHFHKGEAGERLGMRIPEADSGLQHPGFTGFDALHIEGSFTLAVFPPGLKGCSGQGAWWPSSIFLGGSGSRDPNIPPVVSKDQPTAPGLPFPFTPLHGPALLLYVSTLPSPSFSPAPFTHRSSFSSPPKGSYCHHCPSLGCRHP